MKSLTKLFALGSLLILAAAGTGCASPTSDTESEGASTSNMTQQDGVEPTAIKLVETTAAAPGKLGVNSWVAFGTVSKDGDLGVMAYGVNLDGDTTTALYLDYRSGALVAFDKTSRDGSIPSASVNAELLGDYAIEMQAILDATAAAAKKDTGGVRTQTSHFAGCLELSLFASLAVGGAIVGAGIATLGTAAVTTTAVVATAVAVSTSIAGVGSLGGATAIQLVESGKVSVAGYSKTLREMGTRIVDDANACFGESLRAHSR